MNRVRGAVALVVAAIAFGSVATAAGASTSTPAQSIVANVASGPFMIQVQAHRAANAPADSATGEFTAHAALGSLSLFTLHGAVTCLDVEGNRAGLFYPIQSSNPALLSQLGSGVFVYFQLSATGQAQLLGFVPALESSTTSCAPSLTLLPVTSGTVTLTS